MITDLLRLLTLLLVGAAATATVLTRDPFAQTMSISFHGLMLALLFFLYEAPDVALSQIVVGAVALPLMVLLAIARTRRHRPLPSSQDTPR
jgi:uncharacterized MnhB-related membrane protein